MLMKRKNFIKKMNYYLQKETLLISEKQRLLKQVKTEFLEGNILAIDYIHLTKKIHEKKITNFKETLDTIK